MTPRLLPNLTHAFCGLLLFIFLVAIACTPTAIAQDTEQTDAAQAETQAADQGADGEAGASQEESGPLYPEGLDDPDMDLEELHLRLIPLTVDELGALAEVWQGIVRDRTDQVVEQTLKIESLPEERQGDARAELVELTEERGEGFEKYSAVVTNFERKGGDEAAVAAYFAYRNAIIVEKKQRADWRTLALQALNWFISPEGGMELVFDVGVFVASLLGLFIVARFVRYYARRVFSRLANLSKLLQSFLAMVVYWITVAFGLMVVLSALGVDITPLFALVGGGAFVLAFAMQDTLGNLAAGLMIMINRPFDEGDYVTVAGTGGTVRKVNIVSTTVATPDNQVIVIPNSKVWGDVITNVTASDTRRVDLVFGIGYNDSIEQAQQVLEDVVSTHPLVLDDPAPMIRVNELADSSVNFVVRPWARSDDYFTVYWDLTRSVKEAFDARGISIPFPQSDLHVHMVRSGGPAEPNEVPADDIGHGRPRGASDYRSGDDASE